MNAIKAPLRISHAVRGSGGRAIAADQRYRVTVNSFLADGGDNFRVLREASERVGGQLDIDALTEFLRTRSELRPLAPEPSPRIGRR